MRGQSLAVGDRAAATGSSNDPLDAEGMLASERLWLVAIAAVVLGVAALPYLCAVFRTPPSHHFWGAIWYAPDDGLLLSVMQEGLHGRWLHSPPYALADGPGALFYPLHILLGHFCAWTGWDPVHVYHVARLACGGVLLASLYGFVGRFFPRLQDRRFAFLVGATGSGLGGLTLFVLHVRSAELAAPEVYPFFAIMVSLHLTLAIAALLWVLDGLVPRESDGHSGGSPPGRGARWGRIAAGALILSTTQPFGWAVALVVGGLWALVRWHRERHFPRAELGATLVVLVLGIPVVLHELSAIASNPAYVGWRTQVSTPTPPLGQVLLGIGLPLPFALVGFAEAVRRRHPSDLLLVFWTVTVGLLMALPYYQARRFDIAGYVPLVILAVRGIGVLRFDWSWGDRVLALLLNSLTGIVILAVGLSRVNGLDPEFFVLKHSWEAIRYLRDHAPERSVVLAEPPTSMAVLASCPLRVVFGHPAETPRARETYRAVNGFFENGAALPESLVRRVDYILPELQAGAKASPPIPVGFRMVFVSGSVSLYRRGH
jgi:hypothetical protein